MTAPGYLSLKVQARQSSQDDVCFVSNSMSDASLNLGLRSAIRIKPALGQQKHPPSLEVQGMGGHLINGGNVSCR
jgi:hypothetical protein